MASEINLYIIHTEHLDVRKPFIAATLKCFQETFDKVNTAFILKPDPIDINQKEIEQQIKYNKTNDADFDALITPLSLEDISNQLKHREAWRRIAATESANNVLHAVIEDDAIFLESGRANFAALKGCIGDRQWDILFLGLTKANVPEAVPQSLHDASESFKVVPNKEAYLVTPAGAKLLLEKTLPLRYPTRIAISYSIFAKELKAVHPTRRITADGTKLGVLPSAIHANNLLILNNEYMRLWQLFTKGEKVDLAEIEALYKTVEHLKSPDIMHLYGALLFRLGKTVQAKELMLAAIEMMKEKKGIINSRSDLLNNAIVLYQHLQTDDVSTAAIAAPSRYAKP